MKFDVQDKHILIPIKTISRKPYQCRSTDNWADDTLGGNSPPAEASYF